MKIQDVVIYPIAIADAPLRNAIGIHEPYVNRIIVELVGENGFSGFGEAAYSTRTYEDLLKISPELIGADSSNTNAIYNIVAKHFGTPADETNLDPVLKNFDLTPRRTNSALPRTFSAIEVASLDLTGQSVGISVAELLGGRVRESAPFSAYLFYKHAGGGGEGDDKREDLWGEAMTADAIVEQAKTFFAEYGFRSIKFKGGVLPPEDEIAAVRAMAEHLPAGTPLRIDPNCAWSVETSIHVGTELADVLEYFEDPTGEIDGMAAVRKGLMAKGITMPMATNMCVTSFDDVAESVAKDAVQVILGDHHYWGGLRAVSELGRICTTFGLGLSMHSNSHLGVSLMAMAHLAAATPGLTYDADTHYPWLHEEDDILVGGKLKFVNGGIAVSEKPGLGIEVDRDKLAKGKARFESIPYRDRDDVTYMRENFDPTWEKLLPRW
ncbi:MAG: enolase C-terminal domain-like protein [Thermomicrobiales bacterium]